MKRKFILFFIFCSTFFSLIITSDYSYSTIEQMDAPIIYTIEIHNIITSGTAEYISRAIETAESNNAAALVMRINTPGGLVEATLDILENMLGSDIPIITYVEPGGAIAASAGSFILLGGHVAAMTPGTTCGASMPVTISLSEDGSQTNQADEKTIKFLAGHIKSIASERGKNGETAEKFVTENLTLDSYEALDKGVIDVIALSLEDLLTEVHGSVVDIKGKSIKLNTLNGVIKPLEMSLSEKTTGFLGNPQISFILVILGFYGIVIGINAPETYVPEVAGSIALILGLYGIGLFETSLFAGVLIIMGIAMLIAEIYTPTYGVLSLGGIVSIILGGIYFPVEPLLPKVWIRSFVSLTIGIGIGASVFMLLIIRSIIKIKKRPTFIGKDEFTNLTAEVVEVAMGKSSEGLIKVQGELWRAKTNDGSTLQLGKRVVIVGREEMTVIVESIKY